MAKPFFDRERAARILVDAIALGDKTACRLHGITERTLGRYRVRLEGDRQLSEAVRALGEKADRQWTHARTRFLRKAITKLEVLVAEASSDQIKDVAEAVKVVGELDVASQVLNVGNRAHHESAGPAAPPADAGPGADREPADPVH